jgi:hypothetical protein
MGHDERMHQVLQERQETAIQNAQKLHSRQSELPLKEQNPVTTVFQLVERLLS